MDIGPRIRRTRKALGLSQKELGKAAGCKQNTISALERGKTAIAKSNTLQGIANALGVSTGWLSTGTEDAPQDGQDPVTSELLRVAKELSPERRAALLSIALTLK